MTSYALPDLTGTNPDYLKVNLPFFIYQAGVKMEFRSSCVFVDSIRVVLTDGSGTLLVKDVDWRVDSADIDQNAMSEAHIGDYNFNKVLTKAITFINASLIGKQVAVNVQQFYDTTPGSSFDDGSPLEVTPDYLKDMAARLGALSQQVARAQSPITGSDTPIKLLPFDIMGEKTSNSIVNEKIVVNTVIGGKVIRLAQGAFFADSLVVRSNGVTLNPATDYIPYTVSPLTKQTTNVSGIYHFVLLLKEITGDVFFDYHAVGGDVQREDMVAIHDTVMAVKQFLDNSLFLTPQTIQTTAAFRAIAARMTNVETDVRNILTGTPTYGDVTGNTAVRRPIQAPNSDFHWYTIANLFKVQGSNDVVTADQFKGRVFFPGSKVALTFTVDVNINQPRNPVSFDTNGLVFDPLYTLFTDISVAAPVYPMLRVVWNNATAGLAGASLQVGIPLTSLSDQMIVEDLSTAESCWLLDKTGAIITGTENITPTGPRDSGFTLPDNVTVWSAGGANSLSRIHVPEFEAGYLFYAGSNVNLSSLYSGSSTAGLFNAVLPKYFPLDDINVLVITMTSSDGSKIYDIDVPMSNRSSDGTKKYGNVMFTDGTSIQMTMEATLIRAGDGTYTVDLRISEPAGTPSDVVRYLRVRV